ncbi:MAG: hypothetical protein ABSB12_01725 [Candidatus Saccharimonadales bacterium]|jgi:hypothetical protein
MPKLKQPLNELQTEILLILYKFRFATRDLIVTYQELTSRTYTRERLINLLNQGYIARHYDGKDKIAGRPAVYFLDARGIRFLLEPKQLDEFKLNPKVLNLVYKDKHASKLFQDRCLNIFQIYTVFNKLYSDNLDFFTGSELHDNDLFLKPLPFAYVTFSGKYSRKPDYVIELMDSTKSYFIHRRRLNQYLKQYEGYTWQNKTNGSYPTLLLIADSPNLERRLQKSMAFSINSRNVNNFNVYTTTLKALLYSKDLKDKFWSSVTSPDNLHELVDLT